MLQLGDDESQQVAFSLLDTKDTGLVGAVGEVIAWQYLHRKGMIILRFGMGRPWFTNKLTAEPKPNFDRSWLNEQQFSYLNNLWAHGPKRWDFIAMKARELFRKRKKVYLVEVKTRRSGRKRRDLGGSLKGTASDLEKIKALGFVPLLLIVDLLENWKFEINERML